MFTELAPRHTNFTAVVKSLVQYSKTLDLSHKVSLQEARIVTLVKDPDPCRFLQNAMKSSYCRYVRARKILPCFPQALLAAVEQKSKDMLLHFAAAKENLRASRFENAFFPSGEMHYVLLYVGFSTGKTEPKA